MDSELPVKFYQSKSVIVAVIRTPHLENGEEVEDVVRTLNACVNEVSDIHLLLDFHRVSRISVSFLSELQTLRRAVAYGGGLLRFCALPADVREILEVLGLDELYLANNAKHALRKYHAYVERVESERYHAIDACEWVWGNSHDRPASRLLPWHTGGRKELRNATSTGL